MKFSAGHQNVHPTKRQGRSNETASPGLRAGVLAVGSRFANKVAGAPGAKKSRRLARRATCFGGASGASATPRLPQLPADGRGFCARLPPAARRQRAGQNQHPRSDLPHGHAALVSRRGQRADDPARAEGLLRRRQSGWARAEHEIKMYWSARERNLALDGRPVQKLDRLPRRAAHRGVLHRRPATDQRHQPHAAALSWICCSRKRSPAICRCSSATCTACARATPCSSNPFPTPPRSTASPRNW